MFRKGFLDTSEFDICSTLESKMGLEIKLILADIAIFFFILFHCNLEETFTGQTVRICISLVFGSLRPGCTLLTS